MPRSEPDPDAGPRRALTLQTVAEEVGVSRTTVSNAYSRPERLTAELREQILATAERLGYAGPNPLARSLRVGHTGAVAGLVGVDLAYAFTDPVAIEFWRGVSQSFETAGVGLLLLPVSAQPETGEQALLNANVDGVISFALPGGDVRPGLARRRHLPLVVVDSEPVPGCAWVGIDEVASVALMARHLTDLGHRRIGIVSFPFEREPGHRPGLHHGSAASSIWVLRERLAGVRLGLTAAGIAWESVPVQEARANTVADGRTAARALLAAEPCTALLAFSDQLARGALLAADDHGLRVPEDLSVAGFDGIPVPGERRLDLTSI
ncbi:MAG: LacI family transcriptional regulator, partial [Friedmanniella sp.]|nr:LacI family transcriptional regulator [Friedmanniella sp.]